MMRFNNIGLLLLAIFLIIYGIGLIVPTLLVPTLLLGVLALVAGIFILIGR